MPSLCGILLVLVCNLGAAADTSQDDEVIGDLNDNSEHDLFGDPAADSKSQETDAWGSSSITPNTLDDPTTIGGMLLMRWRASRTVGTDYSRARLTAPALMDIYLDARPNDRVRAYARGRIRHDFSAIRQDNTAQSDQTRFGDTPAADVVLDQLFIKGDWNRNLFFTIGKQPIRWGSNHFFSPTDFLHPKRRDPLTEFDDRVGITLLKLHVPIERLGWNLYAIANIDGVRRIDTPALALRSEFLLGNGELSLTAANGANAPLSLGFDLSAPVGWFDLSLEVATKRGVREPHYRPRFDLGDFSWTSIPQPPQGFETETPTALHDVALKTLDISSTWVTEASLGIQLTLPFALNDDVILGIEYWWREYGNSNPDIYPWLVLAGAFRPLRTGKQYLGAYALLMAPGSWDETSFTLSALANLDDQSWLSRLDSRVRVLTYLDINAWVVIHGPTAGEMRLSLELPAPFPGATDDEVRAIAADFMPPELLEGALASGMLAQGLNHPATTLELGVGLTVDF